MAQNDCEGVNARLHYNEFDYVPVMHFGFWHETLSKWFSEEHLSRFELNDISIKSIISDGSEYELAIDCKLGFVRYSDYRITPDA